MLTRQQAILGLLTHPTLGKQMALSPTELRVYRYLDEPSMATEVAYACNMMHQQACNILQRLEQQGYVTHITKKMNRTGRFTHIYTRVVKDIEPEDNDHDN